MDEEALEKAVKITTGDPKKGVLSEYYCLSELFGTQGKDWVPLLQGTFNKEERQFDKFEILVLSGELKDQKRTIYFDITQFFKNYEKKDKK